MYSFYRVGLHAPREVCGGDVCALCDESNRVSPPFGVASATKSTCVRERAASLSLLLPSQ